jgi:dTMP kinase
VDSFTGRRAIFITIEGPDGAGKSSQATMLAERLRAAGHDVVVTREPGGTPLGERIRDVLMGAPAGTHDPLSDALLFNAARSRSVADVIRPALGRGATVISDRYGDSTTAYQGYGGGVDLDAARTITRLATGGLAPDRTVLIDLPVRAGLARRYAGDSAGLTRFETDQVAHDDAYHERVRQGFLALAAEEPARWRVVDGTRDREAVAAAVWKAVADLF